MWGFFWGRKSQNWFFFNFLIIKSSNFITNIYEDFYEDSFEVYNISVRQKLMILRFSPKIFFHFDLGHFRNLLRPNYDLQWPHWGLKFLLKMSAFMWGTVCWAGMNIKASRDRYLSAGTFGPPPASLTDQKARIV